MGARNLTMAQTALKLILCLLTIGCVAARFDDPWFKPYENATTLYKAANGFINRLPLRLESTESFVYGSADMAAVMADMEDEDFVPISVGGKAAVSLWFNNFTDTDCDPDRGANTGGGYLETWYTVSVTPRDSPVSLPDTGPMGFVSVAADPRALVYLARVICSDKGTNPGAALNAINGGREIWGFPKHHIPANIRYVYDTPNNATQFDAEHMGKPAISMRMRLPETMDSVTKIPMDAKTAPDTCIGGPKWFVHSSRYGQAFSATEYVALWDDSTDYIKLYDDGFYGTRLKSWGFDPLVKAHSTDFKIAAFKPANWLK